MITGPTTKRPGLVMFRKSGWDISTVYCCSLDAATLAKDFGPLLVKSQTIFTREGRVNVENLNDSDGVVKQDILDYVIGWNTPPPITRC